MALLKPLGKPAESAPAGDSLKDSFISKTGATTRTTASARPKIKKLSDATARIAKIMVFGDFGTGKTYLLADMLELGMKILVITTDVGGDGLSSVVVALKERGLAHLMDNLYHVTLATYDEVNDFMVDPAVFFPEIYDVGLDMIAWDGFSGFQQYQLTDYVLEDDSVKDKDGNIIVQQFWGKIRQETIRLLNKFLYLADKKTGRPWHKYLTCLEDRQASDDAKADAADEKARAKLKKDVKMAFIQGSAQKLMGPAFDLILQTRKRITRGDDGKPVVSFACYTEGNAQLKVKKRGVKFEPVIPADGKFIWTELSRQLDFPPLGSQPPAEEMA